MGYIGAAGLSGGHPKGITFGSAGGSGGSVSTNLPSLVLTLSPFLFMLKIDIIMFLLYIFFLNT